eukprot:jgi/Chrzof1/9457/Cz04g03240.t1
MYAYTSPAASDTGKVRSCAAHQVVSSRKLCNMAKPSPAPKPLKEGSGSTSVDETVSNTQPITEEEAEQFWAPSDVVEEEERLRQERAMRETQMAPRELVLNKKRYHQLDHLLMKAGLFTQFLTEQMQAAENETNKAVPAAAPKRKGSKATGRSSKRQKTEQNKPQNPTQEMLPLMAGELRDYQLKGVKWLISLWKNGLNGILADQMGLGKTVQTIGFLSHLRSNGNLGPFMVVGPLSTLPNWVSEFERWCPSMPVVLYHGNKQERALLRAQHMPLGPADEKFPVICTSYEIVMADIKQLARYHYKYIVVDEGHRLKNFNCKLIRELKCLSADNKLLLTGTPLQNNLGELWSLLNFLLPEVFSNLADFQGWFDFGTMGQEESSQEIVAAEQRNHVITKLHGILKPFLLRRIKADVEIDLPRKQEVLLYAPMTEQQKTINQQLLDKTLMNEMAKVAAEEGGHTAAIGKLNNVLMQMRKNCNHPDLITAPFSGSLTYPSPEEMVAQSGKMALMDRLLTRLKAGGHKVLIFSQMTKMLDLLESYLEQRGERACRIDGSIPWQERQANIKDFNTDDKTWVFLLSTRAGGLGINLTGADTVIIYDSDWNPHQDLQAMDRCHRIGQLRPVQVFRLATAHSVEGKMLARAGTKMMLERLVIKKGVFKEVLEGEKKSSSMSAAELVELLRSDIGMNDVPQSGAITDDMLETIMDRTHLLQEGQPLPYPPSGVGYEVVHQADSSTLLSGVE